MTPEGTDERRIQQIIAEYTTASVKQLCRFANAIIDDARDATIAAQATEIERLRETLQPFSELGGGPEMQAYHDLDDDIVVYKSAGRAITAGDVRAAREILGPTSMMHFRRAEESNVGRARRKKARKTR